MESAEPKHRWFCATCPIRILLVPPQKVVHPTAERLLILRCQFRPRLWQLPIEQGRAYVVEGLCHADFALERSLQVREVAHHFLHEGLVALDFLQQDDFQWRRNAVFDELQLTLGDFGLDVRRRLLDEILAAHPAAVASCARLHRHQACVNVLRRCHEIVDLCIGVQAEHSWRLVEGQLDNGLLIDGQVALKSTIVIELGAAEVKLDILVEQKVTHVLLQVRVQDAPVVVVCDAASVHGLADQVTQRFPWQDFFHVEGFLQIQIQQSRGHLEVGFVEVVRDIPTNATELSAVLDDRVEERQDVHERSESWRIAGVKVGIADFCIALLDVQFQALGGLGHDFQTALQNAHREC
mmetsp:Transcript_90050/g.275754  ORF Transcript_90050/g.275754 Transcript_90050/m.275754 type:complete len:352 (+) Transcript_90050:520-1575(+)